MTVDPDDPYARPAAPRATPPADQTTLPHDSGAVADRLAATAREHGSTAPAPAAPPIPDTVDAPDPGSLEATTIDPELGRTADALAAAHDAGLAAQDVAQQAAAYADDIGYGQPADDADDGPSSDDDVSILDRDALPRTAPRADDAPAGPILGEPDPPTIRAMHADDALASALEPQLGLDLGGLPPADRAPADKLTDRFIVPPFSTLDSRAGYWRDRKRAWLGLGIQSELGRDAGLAYKTDSVLDPDFYYKKQAAEAQVGRTLTLEEFRRDHYQALNAGPASISTTGTSIFDPVLCEILYRWFTPLDGIVVDPFAGGSVRGIVGAILGRQYYGVELRPEQVAANQQEAARMLAPGTAFADAPMPLWTQGSAVDLRSLVARAPNGGPLPRAGADAILTCPPYADLEVYSDDPRDLSAMPYPVFRAMLSAAMAQSAELLAPNRFACWVVGEARDPRTGLSYGIIRDTVNAAIDAGLHLYNEAILETSVGSGAMRATKQVTKSRKLVRVHQHVLIFVKGDPVKAAAACGDVIVGGAEA